MSITTRSAVLPADAPGVPRSRAASAREASPAGRRLADKFGAWNAALLGGAGYLVAIAVVFLVMPTIAETPGPIRDDAGVIIFGAFPADDLYQFRLYSLGTQLVMWTTIGLVFAALVSRLLENKREFVAA